jgi:hypothetical protein
MLKKELEAMAVQMHIYSAATFFGDFGLSATKIGVLAPSTPKIWR